MASGKSLYLRSAMLNSVLGGPSFTLPPVMYIALSTAVWTTTATGSAMSEVNGGGYTRVAVTNNATNWPNAVNGSKDNGAVFTFPAATSDWGDVKSVYFVDASSGGNALYGADLAQMRTIVTGDTASMAQGALTVGEI